MAPGSPASETPQVVALQALLSIISDTARLSLRLMRAMIILSLTTSSSPMILSIVIRPWDRSS